MSCLFESRSCGVAVTREDLPFAARTALRVVFDVVCRL